MTRRRRETPNTTRSWPRTRATTRTGTRWSLISSCEEVRSDGAAAGLVAALYVGMGVMDETEKQLYDLDAYSYEDPDHRVSRCSIPVDLCGPCSAAVDAVDPEV